MRTPQELFDALIAAGCLNFHIVGISKDIANDTECLRLRDGQWEIYYTERGIERAPYFVSEDFAIAGEFYFRLITRMEHWHLQVFMRDAQIFEAEKAKLLAQNVKIKWDCIPNYAFVGDKMYRIFMLKNSPEDKPPQS